MDMIKNDLKSVIFKVRGEFVIFDKDIARLYGVTTGALNQAVKRNRNRFPQDFMSQLHQEEYECLKSQIVIAKGGRGGSRVMPNVFTEHGVLMLASVLRSEVAAIVSINIARTFAEMRRQITSMAEFSADIALLKSKMELLERCVDENVEAINDISEDVRKEIDCIYNAIAALTINNNTGRHNQIQKIGFKTGGD